MSTNDAAMNSVVPCTIGSRAHTASSASRRCVGMAKICSTMTVPAEQVTCLNADDGDHRHQRVCAPHAASPPRGWRAPIARATVSTRAPSSSSTAERNHPHHGSGQQRAERDRRLHQRLQVAGHRVAERHKAGGGQHGPLRRDEQDEKVAMRKLVNRQPQQADHPQDEIGRPPAVHRRHDPRGMAIQQRDQRRTAAPAPASPGARSRNSPATGWPELSESPRSPPNHVADPAQILHRQRGVEPVARALASRCLRRHVRADADGDVDELPGIIASWRRRAARCRAGSAPPPARFD